ncbi:MAG: phage holin family protein, partial [Streptosporangiaceae bacterium]
AVRPAARIQRDWARPGRPFRWPDFLGAPTLVPALPGKTLPLAREELVMTDVHGTARPAGARDSSTGDLVKQLTEQVSRLVRDELKLARVEMTRKGARAGRGIGLFGGSGIIALYGTGCLIAAAVMAIATAVTAWLAALIVGAAPFARRS